MKNITISLLIVIIIIGAAVLFSGREKKTDVTTVTTGQSSDNVSIIGGQQIIEINAKGGYLPRATTAQAGIPTVIKMKTKNTFDCSSAVIIPALGYRNNLPPSGETLINVPSQKAGTVLQGMCAMGMYGFRIKFE